MLRLPVFCWTMVVTCLMVVFVVPGAVIAAMALIVAEPPLRHRTVDPIGYQHLFWFYGHPAVYVMFFPFVGAVAEVVATLLAAGGSSATGRSCSRCWCSRRSR